MRSWWLSLLLVSAVTLHGCLSDTAEPDVQDGRSIGDIIDLYNQKEGVTYLYKFLDQLPPVPMEEDENPNRRGFIIKETVCLKTENPDLVQCDFKPDGDVKICSLDLGDEDPEDIMCTSLNKDPGSVMYASLLLHDNTRAGSSLCTEGDNVSYVGEWNMTSMQEKSCGETGPREYRYKMGKESRKEVRVKRSSRRRPCRGRSCRPRLTGGYTLIGFGLPGKKQNRPNYMWV
ncbi:cathelicidin-related peptide Pt_CRAMP2-like isoform X1 [Bufo bufo]|uniref:cathelicidin-related peptide Pt_CRAMP2-like isoform X1 n=1 Tax=Bufo bufo TaxID=8384 RepID=UPI001ABDE696|nr:cathelicidin-related peptide Pt_CRAMP2-like isoform X1 [Bufo bufo]